MGKRAEFQPAWLVSLMNQWAIHDLKSQTGGLGYASGSSWMRGLKSSPASSVDPTGYSARDFSDVEDGMVWLMQAYKPLWAAVSMYYKPWLVDEFRRTGYPFGAGNKTYYNRLHEGHAKLAERLNAMRAARISLIEATTSKKTLALAAELHYK